MRPETSSTSAFSPLTAAHATRNTLGQRFRAGDEAASCTGMCTITSGVLVDASVLHVARLALLGIGVGIVEERLQGEPHPALRDQPGGRLVEELAVLDRFHAGLDRAANRARRVACTITYMPQSSAASTAARNSSLEYWVTSSGSSSDDTPPAGASLM